MMFHRFAGLRHAHFVGIGGAGMSGIAEVLLAVRPRRSRAATRRRRGDASASRRSASRIAIGHSPDHLDGVDLVVISSAIAADNPEVARGARARHHGGAPRRDARRADAAQVRHRGRRHPRQDDHHLAGRHAAHRGRARPDGDRRRPAARLRHRRAARAAATTWWSRPTSSTAASCRSAPILAVITNDRRRPSRHLRATSTRSATPSSPSPARAVLRPGHRLPRRRQRAAHPAAARRPPRGHLRLSPRPTSSPPSVETRADRQPLPACATRRRGELGEIELPLPGLHNVRNALAAIGVGLALGLAVAGHRPRARRLRRRPPPLRAARRPAQGAEVVDDYAHHPTEVAATLAAARQVFPRRADPRRLPAAPLLAHPRPRRRISAAPCSAPTTPWSPTSTPSREEPIAGRHRRAGGAARRAPPATVGSRYCPTWRDAAGAAARRRSAGRRGADAGRRRHLPPGAARWSRSGRRSGA